MKLYFILNLIGLVFTEASAAPTLEEYAALPPEGKIEVLKGKTAPLLSYETQLLRLFTMSLRDSSPAVQRIAAQTSVFLMGGLQDAKPLGKMPAFTQEDSAALQQALVALLDYPDKQTRAGAAMALAYSTPPNDELERLLLTQLKKEAKGELAAGILEAMGKAGYTSDAFIAASLAHMQPDVNGSAIYYAGQALAHLRPESALDALISLAAKASPAQQYALRTLAAYGTAAARAKPMLQGLMDDQSMIEDIRLQARQTLDAITTGKTPVSSPYGIKLVTLWPLALSDTAAVPPDQGASPPGSTASGQTPSLPKTDTGRYERESSYGMWPWVAGSVALLLLVLFVLKRRA